MLIAYRTLKFPELRGDEDPKKHRVSRSMLVEKMEAEASAAFLKDAVIGPFEETLLASDREEFDTGEFVIEVEQGGESGSTRWVDVYNLLRAFLDVRADDSRAASFDGVRYFEGVGYCIRVEDLNNHLNRLIDEKTSKSDKDSRSLKWPTKKRDEELPTEINLPDGSYYRVTRENGRAVLQAKRFIAGIGVNVISPYKAELTRWFEAQTGYHPPEKIPDRELGHAELPVEFARGSYGWVQLVRQETPEYKGAIGQVRGALKDMVDKKPVKQFKYTLDGDGVPFVNIKSLATFLSDEGMRTNKLVRIGHRYSVTP